MTTVTVELLRDDALELLNQLELLYILRVKKQKIVKKIKISDLRGQLKTGLSIEEIDEQLKDLPNE